MATREQSEISFDQLHKAVRFAFKPQAEKVMFCPQFIVLYYWSRKVFGKHHNCVKANIDLMKPTELLPKQTNRTGKNYFRCMSDLNNI